MHDFESEPVLRPERGPEGRCADLGKLLGSSSWWRRDSLLVAASGGLDSIVLLDLLHRERLRREGRERAFRLGAACLDHGWRGAEGRRDAAFLAEFCARRGIPLFAGLASSVAGGRPGRRSLEARGREARYRFLSETARRKGYAAVATAHHAGDQLETLLWRLARGGREEGLAGILPVVRLAGVEVVRPLLDVAPEALVAYAEANRLPFREDATNRDLRFLRNRLRLLAVPRVDRADAAVLLRLAGLRRRLVESAADRLREPAFGGAAVRDAGGGVRLPVSRIAALPPDLRREVLRWAFHSIAPPDVALSERALDQLERLVASPEGGCSSLPGVRAHVSCGWLLLERLAAPEAVCDRLARRLRLAQLEAGERRREGEGRAGTDEVPPLRPRRLPVEVIGAEPARTGVGGARDAWEAFDPRGLEGPVVVRAWRPGDRIEVRVGPEPGRRGRKKLKEIFREARIPRWERERYPVVADDRGVLCVPGVRRSERARPVPGCPAVWLRVPYPRPGPGGAPAAPARGTDLG